MTCPSCKSTWESQQQPGKCPFCGASLKQSDGEIRTVADAIKKVVADRGLDVLKTPKVIKSMVSDFVHDCDKEKRLLSYVIDSGAFEQIRQICEEKNPAQRSALIQKTEQRIMDYALISPELTQHILSLVFEGLNIPYEANKLQPETKVTPAPTKTTKKKAPDPAMTAEEMFKLGERYYFGKDEPQDYKNAAKWFEKAALQGHAAAQANLGYCYENGLGVPQSYAKAVEWFEKAARQGHARAQTNLGYCYSCGRGVPQNYDKAVEWYERAAQQGYAIAQNNLGNRYYDGEGVPQSYTKAVEWYEKAAKQGNASAQDNLGECYENGRGVPKNLAKAKEWYQKAAGQGNAHAKKALENL